MLSENIKETVRFPKMLNVKLYIYYQEKHNNKVVVNISWVFYFNSLYFRAVYEKALKMCKAFGRPSWPFALLYQVLTLYPSFSGHKKDIIKSLEK